MTNRTNITIPAQFGSSAQTTIPDNPVQGTPYRDTSLSAGTINQGWPYDVQVDSAQHNQLGYLITGLLRLLEQTGILPWCATVVYASAGVLCLGSDNQLYIALQASTNVDPVSGTNHASYWQLFSTYLVTPYSTAKAWVNFSGRPSNGACTINDSMGVSSVVRQSSGVYRITFSSNFSNSNYVFSGFARSVNDGANNGGIGINLTGSKTVSYIDIRTAEGGTTENPSEVGIVFFGK